jgi:hypothetical protein
MSPSVVAGEMSFQSAPLSVVKKSWLPFDAHPFVDESIFMESTGKATTGPVGGPDGAGGGTELTVTGGLKCRCSPGSCFALEGFWAITAGRIAKESSETRAFGVICANSRYLILGKTADKENEQDNKAGIRSDNPPLSNTVAPSGPSKPL